MNDDMTWKAAISSEIFREYLKNELMKSASSEEVSPEEEKDALIQEFEKFQEAVKASPNKVKVFKALQHKFATDPEYTAKVKKSFVDAVMLLDLD